MKKIIGNPKKVAALTALIALMIFAALAPALEVSAANLGQKGNWGGNWGLAGVSENATHAYVYANFSVEHISGAGKLQQYTYYGSLQASTGQVGNTGSVTPGSSFYNNNGSGQTVGLGQAGIAIPRAYDVDQTVYIYAYVINASTGSSVGGHVYTITVHGIPTCTVYYSANHDGPSDSSTQAELADPHGANFFIAQDGMIQQNGSNISTWGSANNTMNLWNLDSTTGLNLKKKGYYITPGAEWNSKADGTGTTYSQSATYAYNAFTKGSTLYANWQPNEYHIQFMPNGADSGAMPQQTMYFDQKTKAISNSYIKDGYKLVGWDRNPDADPDGTLDVMGDKGIIANAVVEDAERGDTITLYAIWGELSPSETQIHAGKIKTVEGNGVDTADEFTFRLEPLEGMTTDNEATLESGKPLTAEELPMPEGSENVGTSSAYKDVTLTGMAGTSGLLRTQSFGTISFEQPGWYMYKVTELSDSPASNVTYDKDSYFVTAYVQYLEDTGLKMEVVNTTAWHNRNGLANNRPNTDDISSVPDVARDSDRDGTIDSYETLKANDKGVYGKTGIGKQSIVVNFWNTEFTQGIPPVDAISGLYVTKNLKGNLGDRTKKFEYSMSLSGLSANTTYAVDSDAAELGTGFEGGAFTTDENGTANLEFKLRDDEGVLIADLPLNSVFNITEGGSDHVPSYEVYTDAGTVKTGNALFGNSVSTGNVTITRSGDLYTVIFDNFRELATNTGVLERGLPIVGVAVVIIAAAAFIVASARKKNKKMISEE